MKPIIFRLFFHQSIELIRDIWVFDQLIENATAQKKEKNIRQAAITVALGSVAHNISKVV